MIFRTNGVKCGKVAACGIYKRKAPHLDELLAVWTGAEHPSINPLYLDILQSQTILIPYG